jgi:protein TonB
VAAVPRPTPAKPGVAAAPAARNWDDFKRQAAQRMVAASPQGSYTGPVPEVLLAIPVIEIELNADGSVRSTRVMRTPTQATDTVQMAIDAIRRAAPYGDVSRLSRPWKFVEVFLFDDDRRFKPRTLDD